LRFEPGRYAGFFEAHIEQGGEIAELKHAEEQLRASQRELARVSRQTTMGAMTPL
jgi:C4-dicarboxylate-specific signal transduction histidine kinase